MRVAVARQVHVAKDRGEAEAALKRAAAYTQRTVEVSRAPTSKGGSHVLAYASRPGATEANAVFGVPERLREQLEGLRKAGVEYVLLTMLGGKEQLRRFAREVMPGFAGKAAPHVSVANC
jgi:alkanesulfonate monooxygenase SsuD/methylene tetrahydromethanopterin reductase-like flavin-dependent oxidoreductase (luciferase family)